MLTPVEQQPKIDQGALYFCPQKRQIKKQIRGKVSHIGALGKTPGARHYLKKIQRLPCDTRALRTELTSAFLRLKFD